MGATGWKYFVPYEADVLAALHRLREDVFAEGQYSTRGVVTRPDLVAALKACGSDWESMVKIFSSRASDPTLPAQTREKFAALLKQYSEPQASASDPIPKPATIQDLLDSQGESGTHSILDIVRVSPIPAFGAVSPLPASKLEEIFGSEKPTHVQIESKYEEGALEEYVSQRWQGIYITAYRSGSPDEIFFAGCSGD